MSARLNLDTLYPSDMGEILVRLRPAEVSALELPVMNVEELPVEVVSEARYLPLPE